MSILYKHYVGYILKFVIFTTPYVFYMLFVRIKDSRLYSFLFYFCSVFKYRLEFSVTSYVTVTTVKWCDGSITHVI